MAATIKSFNTNMFVTHLDDIPNVLEEPSTSDDDSSLESDAELLQATVPKGMKSEAIDFYKNKLDEWTQEYPSHIAEALENDETAQYAVLKRNEKSKDPSKKFSLKSIIIQSPLIRKVLGSVFEGYKGITPGLGRLKFKKPFNSFFHRWEAFTLAKDTEQDAATRSHLHLLWDILYKELKSTIETRDDLLSQGVMTFDFLWTMFEPATLIFQTGRDGSERVMRATASHYVPCDGTFNVSSYYTEWDGEKFGTAVNAVSINAYQGTRNIIDLSTYPLAYHTESTAVQQRCIARARTWVAYCKYSFMEYKGPAYDVDGNRFNVNSRVIIDTAAYKAFNPNNQLRVYPLKDDVNYVEPISQDQGSSSDEAHLDACQLLLCTQVLQGYSLKDKVWLQFNVSLIKDIVWSTEAFTRLVLPNDTKDLVLAFAQSQIKNEVAFDDVILGKGRGVIMLLSGPPGVGKTLTAEAVAETMRVPLFVMAAGDLGTEPREIESSLKQITEMTTRWKAVLLLDEADVYLEARSPHDLERNKIVSIFLRILEYYEGFLFLTSNQTDNIDAAFESRIHLSLMYNGLSFAARRQVWVAFLSRQNATFSDEQVDVLAKVELNGRQIKNILKTAQLLATSQDAMLSYAHVETITKLRAANACIPLKGDTKSNGACICRGA